MGAVIREAMIDGLRSLVPISALPDDKFEELLGLTRIEEVESGQNLFAEGDTENRAVYLLSGKVLLLSGKSIVETVVGGSSAARYPLAHHVPRQLTARAKGKVTFVRIDTQLLDRLLTMHDSGETYEVSEVLEDDDDWMTQLLQSDAFANLPAGNIQALFMQLVEVPVVASEIIMREGDPGDYFYIVRKGRCKVTVTEPTGKKKVVAELGPADSFGEEALISGGRRNATISMITDGILMRLPQESFDRLMKEPLINWVDYDEATEIIKQGGVWLDVRLPNEHKQVSIAGSKNLPLSVLRNNIDRLETNRKYVTYCDNGTRSSVAAFLLSQRGLDAYVLAGGYTSSRHDTAEVEETKPDKAVIDFNAQQVAARKKAEEQAAALLDERAAAEQRAADEARRREELEAELKQMREEQRLASERAEAEVNKRLKAEDAVAQMKKEQENAYKKAQEEIQKRKLMFAEAERIKAEAEMARKKAEDEAAKLRAEREQVRLQADKELAELQQQREALQRRVEEETAQMLAEAQAARQKAEQEAKQLHEEAETARKKAEADSNRLRAEAQAAKQKAEEETRRLQEEQQRSRDQAEEQARRLRAEAEELRRRVEEDARQRSEQLASEIVAEAEAARYQAEQEAARLLAEAEGARLEAEAEAARFFSSQEEMRLQAEQEVLRLQGEAEQARLRADEEQRRMSEVEARRLAAEEEAARLRVEAEAARMAAEAEARRRQAEAETARLVAEEEAARIKAEAEHARIRAEEEVARLQAEAETARMGDDNAEQLARLESDTKAARLEAEEAMRLKAEAEERRKLAEKEAIRIKVEAEQTRQAAEDEARRLIEEAEQARARARHEAAEVSQTAEQAREQARDEVRRLQQEAEGARKKAEADASRLRNEADDAQKRAEEMVQRLREEADRMRTAILADAAAPAKPEQALAAESVGDQPVEVEEIKATETEEFASEELAEDRPIEIEDDGIDEMLAEVVAALDEETGKPGPEAGSEDELLPIDEIAEIPAIEDDSELVVSDAGRRDSASSLLVSNQYPESILDEVDEISRLIDATASETVKSGFVLPEDMRASAAKRGLPMGMLAGIGGAVLLLGVGAYFLFSGGDETAPPVSQLPPASDTASLPAEPAAPVASTEPAVVEPVPEPSVTETVVTAPVAPEPVISTPVAPAPVAADFKPSSFADALSSGGSAPRMQRIPAGSYSMGSPGFSTNFDERPSHTVSLDGFAMSRYEVTVSDYRQFLAATGRDSSFLRGRDGKLPVTNVSWVEAQQYVKWLSEQTGRRYRLPSEAEWEFAAGAGAQTVYWWGNDMLADKANCFGCGGPLDNKLAEVGSFEANIFGLHDMSGNVMEWVQDCVNPSYNGAPLDGAAWTRGDCKKRIVRGGAYNTPADNLRTRKRDSYALDSRLDNIGLRIVRD